jgi:uncharacterized membrane protein YgcG
MNCVMTMWRCIRLAIAFAVVCVASEAQAAERTPYPAFTGARVYLADVSERFDGLTDQIKRLEKRSPQTYYVAVVKSFGDGQNAASDYVNGLYRLWRSQASRRGLSLDSERSVIVAVALGDRKIAIHAGEMLREKLGLHAEVLSRNLIDAKFKPLASQEKYPQAIASLLDGINDWIALKDRSTASTTAAAPLPGPAATVAPPAAKTTTVRTSEAKPVAGRTASPAAGSATTHAAIGLVLAMVAVVLLIAGAIWWKQRRERSQVGRQLKDFRSQSVQVMDRLDRLKERLKLLPAEDPDFREPMSGETRAFHDQIQARVTKLWDRWLEIMNQLDQAEKLASKVSSPFDQKKVHEAAKLLDCKPIFAEMETEAAACAGDLDKLNAAHEEARAVLEPITADQPKIAAGCASARKVDLPTAAFDEEHTAIAAEIDRAKANLTADPIGTKTALEKIKSRSQALLGRIERVVALVKEAEKTRANLELVKGQAAAHRREGLTLVEDGGNPDEFLNQASQAHAQAVEALGAGDPDAAARHIESAQALAKQAQDTIEAVKKAKAFCILQQTARARETERLRAALPQAESYQDQLAREFAPSSWQAVARNLDQIRSLLSTFDRLAGEAAAAASSTSQKYLAGARIYEQLGQQQQIVLRLMSALGEQLNALFAARNECQKARRELDQTANRVEQYLHQNAGIIGDLARQSYASATKSLEANLGNFDVPRPDWPALRQALAQAGEEFAIAQSHAETDVRSFEQLKTDFNRTRQEADRIYALLAGHREDRLAANQRYQAAADVLDRVSVDLSSPRGQSARLLEEVRGAAADLQQAEQMAREDIQLAQQAMAELAQARRAIDQSRSYFAMGVGVDASSAEAELYQAEQLLEAQNYEEAIRRGGAAIQAMRQAQNFAAQEAQRRQMEEDAELRRRAAYNQRPGISTGALAAGAAAAVILDRMSQAAPPSPSEPVMSSPLPGPEAEPQPGSRSDEPEAAVGSWSDEAGEGSW